MQNRIIFNYLYTYQQERKSCKSFKKSYSYNLKKFLKFFHISAKNPEKTTGGGDFDEIKAGALKNCA